MILVTLEEAKQHLQIEGDDYDAEVYRALQAASERVADYCNNTDTTAWDEFSTPVMAQRAALILTRYYYDETRSGDESGRVMGSATVYDASVLPGVVRNLLTKYRVPPGFVADDQS